MSAIKSRLRDFKLSGIYNSYEERIKYAQDKSLSYEEFLELILEDEENNRRDNSFKKRYSRAKFPYSKKIEDFDFSFQPLIDKRLINDICTCSFVKEEKNVVFIGQPGTAIIESFCLWKDFHNSSRNKRYKLENKTVYADILDSDTFGKNISYIAQEKYNLRQAENILLISDGDRWIKNFQVDYLPGSVHQLDHYHLKKKLRTAYSGSPHLLGKALDLIHRKKQEKLLEFLRLSKDNGAIADETADDLISYVETNLDDIWGIDSLYIKVPIEVLVVVSGAIEKNVDINIARRFKGRGMSWSRQGARNLMVFRIMSANNEFDNYFLNAA